MPTAVSIRFAAVDDAAALAALKVATFRQTFLQGFQIPYPPADLAQFEAESYSEAKVRSELLDPSHQTWVAEQGGALCGYAHAGPCKLPHPDVAPGAVELYQLYLLDSAKGQGLGRRLLELVLDTIAPDNGPAWLGVWSGNDRAQALYARHGFRPVGRYQFRVGSWLDEELIFRRP